MFKSIKYLGYNNKLKLFEAVIFDDEFVEHKHHIYHEGGPIYILKAFIKLYEYLNLDVCRNLILFIHYCKRISFGQKYNGSTEQILKGLFKKSDELLNTNFVEQYLDKSIYFANKFSILE